MKPKVKKAETSEEKIKRLLDELDAAALAHREAFKRGEESNDISLIVALDSSKSITHSVHGYAKEIFGLMGVLSNSVYGDIK